MLSDLGFNPYTSLLVTTESEIRDHAELVRKMVAASVPQAGRITSPTRIRPPYLHEKNPAMDLASWHMAPGLLRPRASARRTFRRDWADNAGPLAERCWNNWSPQNGSTPTRSTRRGV